MNKNQFGQALVVCSENSLKTLIDHCHQFGHTNNIKFNSTKSAILPILPEDKKKNRTPPIHMNNEVIPVVEDFKYLGHILSDNKNDDLDRKTA